MINLKSLLVVVASFIVCLQPMIGLAQVQTEFLKNIPSDLPYIAVVNVRQMLESSIYYAKAQSGQRLIGQISEDLDSFSDQTGVDPLRDISYLILSDKLMVVHGQFDLKRIRNCIRGNKSLSEMKYGDPIVAMLGNSSFPQPMGYPGLYSSTIGLDVTRIAFLSEHDIAIGLNINVAKVLKAAKNKFTNMQTNKLIMALIGSIQGNPAIWFAGKDNAVFQKSPVPITVGPLPSFSIKGIVGGFNLTNAVVGRTAIAAVDSKSAEALNNCYARLDSVAQFIEVPAGVKSLANGLKFERKEEWINLSLNYSVDALQIIRDWSLYPVAASGPDASADKPKLPSEPNLVNPFPLFAEKPQYTVEARKSRAEGMVVIRGIVRRNGLVTDLKILTGLGSGLDESAMEVIKTKWRFIPGTFNGKPVDVMTDIQVRFFLY